MVPALNKMEQTPVPTHNQWAARTKGGREFYFWFRSQGIARTQSPTNRNCTPESSTFGKIARVNPTVVQWRGLALGEPLSRSRIPLCQVSMRRHSDYCPI